jgi:hypothetical protein
MIRLDAALPSVEFAVGAASNAREAPSGQAHDRSGRDVNAPCEVFGRRGVLSTCYRRPKEDGDDCHRDS